MTRTKTPSAELPPHPVLDEHYAGREQRVPYIRQLFDQTAPSYDRINRWMSLGTGERYRLEALRRAGIRTGDRVLDIATGTGVLARHASELVGPEGTVIAIDPSLPMLQQAGKRGVENRACGIAESLPLEDASVDLISMGYALRHVCDLRVAFDEYLRVLKPGGRLLLLEMVPPDSPLGYRMTRLYLKHLVPSLAVLVTGRTDARRLMQYYWDTVDRCVPPRTIETALKASGFSAVKRSVLHAIMNEYTALKPGL
ncbi:Methyltransferase type 11 [Thiorhodococcus drewsii AZ1]|uniref:Methyltransferase type 11 n=1 Tax=Thiorhodococcus drewsii AZ1 TaxID=765913 RepID=G2E4U9_9GAMM|nr:class I SAM-dependent methyltransferase [Thiorhodococcus drewsii]EGV29120.1 Methyltransferase type 11 [Thiorhodococcus drewsii AZ1]